jgi:RNA polymerase sigma-70 factor (ECF subfamily)
LDRPDLEEADLSARLARGDRSAFDEITALHQGRVARLVFRLLGWDAEAEDVVQDVFLAAYQNRKRFRGQSSVLTWLMAIAINRCRRHHLRQALRLRVLRDWWRRRSQPPDPPADDSPMQRELHERVRSAVRALPQPLREAAVLRFLEDLPPERIAEITGVSRGAVDVRLHRARQRLRNDLAMELEE